VRAHTPEGTSAEVEAREDSGLALITVSDDGPGVPVDELDRIFGRFHRVDSAPRSPGSGLGLAIVAEAAAAHGGHVAAELNPVGGLRVTLSLPVSGGMGARSITATSP
jgi:signal transduction histidine kinase